MTTSSIVDTRQRILDMGARQLWEVGYDRSTLRSIAEASGVKAASIYYHFASKEELFSEVLAEGMILISRAYDDAVAGIDDPTERFRLAVTAHLHALFAFGPYTAAHVRGFGLAPDAVRNEIVPLRDAYEKRWDALLGDMRSSGLIHSDLNILLVRLHLLASLNSSLEWFKPGSIDDLADVVLTQFWNAA